MHRYVRAALLGLVTWTLLGISPQFLVAQDAPAAVKTFADTLQAKFAAGDAKFWGDNFDHAAFLNTTMKGVAFSEATRKKLAEASKSAVAGVGAKIAQQVTAGGTYRLLRIVRDGSQWKARYRLLTNEGLNYHDIHLDVGDNAKVTIGDCYVLLTGENLSVTLRRYFLPFVVNQNRSFLEKLKGKESAAIKHAQEMLAFTKAGNGGQIREAVKLYHNLPIELQEDKNVMVLLLTFTNQKVLDDDPMFAKEYEAAVKRYTELFTSDANVDLMLIDYHIVRKEHPKCLQALDRLDAKLDDPYLDHMRANVHYSAGEIAKAKPLFAKVIAYDPSLTDPYYSMIQITLDEKDYGATTQLLTQLYEHASKVFRDLSQNEVFKGYAASPEYQKYKDFLATKNVSP